MTTAEFQTIATNKLQNISTSELIIEVKKLANDFSNGADIVFNIAMDVLMNRLPENEYIEFCNSL
jgi:hypothetical protein